VPVAAQRQRLGDQREQRIDEDDRGCPDRLEGREQKNGD
jgi:hypothetical protein